MVLRFGDGVRVDMVANMTEAEAIADFLTRILHARTASMPLLEATTVAVPKERLDELAGTKVEPVPPVRPSISFAGLIRSVRTYVDALGNDRSKEPAAKEALTGFFDRYGIDLDFRVAAPLERKPEGKRA